MATDISKAVELLKEDFDAADNLVSDIYTKYFAEYFKRTTALEEKFHNTSTSISDAQLEEIITAVPFDMYMVSCNLAQFKQHYEIVKLKIKDRKKLKVDDGQDLEFQLMSIAYSAVINQVEHQISFAKELIMGAKKVWDARKRTETSVPIKEHEHHTELPDYL